MKLVGSDFDGTIPCPTEKYIKDSTRALIASYRNEGHKFVIVTGRSPVSFQKAIVKYGIDFYDYLICANGAVVYDSLGNIIALENMKKQAVTEILKEVQAMALEAVCWINTLTSSMTLSQWYACDQCDQVLSIAIAFPSLEEANQFPGFSYSQCACFRNGIYLDVMAKGVSKAAALLELYDHCACDELYCVGDGINDIPMLACTKNSYSFPYADEAVRMHANVICEEFDDVMKEIMKIKV